MDITYEWLTEHVNIFEDASSHLTVGLYPGAFKPPHIGHYQAAVDSLKNNDIVIVLISGQDRGEGEGKITAEQSAEIWKLYKMHLGDNNLKIVRVPTHVDKLSNAKSTVITATYDIVHLLNNKGSYVSTGRFTQEHPVARRVYNSIDGYDKYTVTLQAGSEDFKGRYSGLPFDGIDEEQRYIGHDVADVKKGLNKRLASASGIRPYVSSFKKRKIKSSNDIREQILAGALKHEDFASIRKNIPGDDDIKDQVIDILLR